MDEVLSEVLASPVVGIAATLVGVVAVTIWLAVAWWSYADASRRSDSRLGPLVAAGWVFLGTPLLLPLSLAVYFVARPHATIAETREQELALVLINATAFGSPDCPSCNARVDPGWLRCPACAAWLALPCDHCGRASAPNLETCPFCGDEGSRVSLPIGRGHERAAASETPAAADVQTVQRRIASSLRPATYAASRESSSASS